MELVQKCKIAFCLEVNGPPLFPLPSAPSAHPHAESSQLEVSLEVSLEISVEELKSVKPMRS